MDESIGDEVLRSRLAATVFIPLAITGSGLAGCNRQSAQAPAPPATGAPIASLPLAQGAAPPAAVAPPVSALPAATPLRIAHVAPRERYRYIDRAYALGEAFADSPPDYTVPYEGERPWVWRSAAGEYRLIEPTPDGDRVYYYDAGSDQPFLVRDPQYAYGYDRGQLVVIYDQAGRPLPYDPDAAEWAARYDARARALYRAAVHERREAAYADAWRDRQAQVLAQQQAWAADQQRDAEWRAWRDEHRQAEQRRAQQAQWDAERAQRIAYAAQVTSQLAATQAPHRAPWPSPGANGRPPGAQTWPNQAVQSQRPQFQPPAQPQLAAAQNAAARQQADAAARAQQQAQAEAARHAQAQAAQQAAARQQAQAEAGRRAQAQAAQQAARQQAQAAARAQQQAQAEAGRRAQAQAAQQAAHQEAEAAARAQQQAQAEAGRRAQAQAAQQAAHQQAEAAARAQQQAQAEAGRRAQAQAAQQAAAAHQQAAAAAHAQQQAQAEAARHAQAAQQAAKDAAAHAHPGPGPKRKDEAKPQPGGG